MSEAKYLANAHYDDPPYGSDKWFSAERLARKAKRVNTVRDLERDKIKLTLEIIQQEPTAYWKQKYAEAAILGRINRMYREK